MKITDAKGRRTISRNADRSGHQAPSSPLISRRGIVLGAGAAAFTGLLTAKARAQSSPSALVKAAQAEGKVVIYSTTDSQYSQPMFKAFTRKFGVVVEENALATSNLYSQVIAEAAANQVRSDVVWSASTDLQMALQVAGHAQVYVSEETSALPNWARYKDALFATSIEPVGFAYNTRMLQPDEVPHTYADLARFVSESAKLQGRVATTDAEKSGLAYMLHANDAKLNPQPYWKLIAAMGKAGAKTYVSSANVMESVTSGENVLATHINGSYALEIQAKNPNLRAHFLSNFTACMRVSFINARAPRPNAAKLLQDFMLSHEGQSILAANGLPAARGDEGSSSLRELKDITGANVEPIKLDETLLENIDKGKRLAFVRDWKKAIGR
ncbi:ABC transporter substrate-binding protein [Bradyrhizobium sp. KB893862 SZCCT0404]|uniref:ABC transporter substrate-binding protein n=1 Tax=Bradyrhizobium sp. KB893862 SZCCT0404 TaxID=2807672 RepID=UPI001BA7FE13|nr:ABC transporter substrate-binding protein [Bradyrhizobium sp. KB893862 SZCCT0404]